MKWTDFDILDAEITFKEAPPIREDISLKHSIADLLSEVEEHHLNVSDSCNLGVLIRVICTQFVNISNELRKYIFDIKSHSCDDPNDVLNNLLREKRIIKHAIDKAELLLKGVITCAKEPILLTLNSILEECENEMFMFYSIRLLPPEKINLDTAIDIEDVIMKRMDGSATGKVAELLSDKL